MRLFRRPNALSALQGGEGVKSGRPRKKAVWLSAAGIAVLTPALVYLALPPPALDRAHNLSMLALARDGSILRGFLSADDKWRLPVRPNAIDPVYRRMLIATEDRRFAEHPGVDPLAVLRALGQLARNGHIVSGASTLTMQAVRLLERRPRTLSSKLVEMAEALALERRLAKDDILSLYLTLAPFGGNLEGVRAASLAYFGANTFMPDYLHATGQAALIAPCLAALNIGQIPASVAVGLIPMPILGRRRTSLVVAGVLVAALLAFLVLGGVAAIVASVAFGLFAAYVLTLSFAMPALIGSHDEVPRISAGSFTLGYGIAFLTTLLSGAAWDLTHNAASAFLPIFAAGCIVLVLGPRLGAAVRAAQ